MVRVRVVECVCSSQCKRLGRGEGQVVSVSTRNRHRQVDLDRQSRIVSGILRGDERTVLGLDAAIATNCRSPFWIDLGEEIQARVRRVEGSIPSASNTGASPSSQGTQQSQSGRIHPRAGEDDVEDNEEDDTELDRMIREGYASSDSDDEDAGEKSLVQPPAALGASAPPLEEEAIRNADGVVRQALQETSSLRDAEFPLPASSGPSDILLAALLSDSTYDQPGVATAANVGEASSPPPEAGADLSDDERATLLLYQAWLKSGASERSYALHAEVLRILGHKVKTLYLARKLVERESEVAPITIDMCRDGCAAYTGPFAAHSSCPRCGLARYRSDGKTAFATYKYMPVLQRLQAYFSVEPWAQAMRSFSTRTAKAKRTFAGGASDASTEHRFTDIGDGFIETDPERHRLLEDPRSCILYVSTDGAQLLANKKPSSTWVVLIQIGNLPASERFKFEHQHVAILIPGPRSPGDIESFIWPLCAEIARLGHHGAWTWDAVAGEWFRLRAYLGGIFADQPASAKLSRLTGHSGTCGCRACQIRAVRALGTSTP